MKLGFFFPVFHLKHTLNELGELPRQSNFNRLIRRFLIRVLNESPESAEGEKVNLRSNRRLFTAFNEAFRASLRF